jgi:hypothetical protein
MMVSDTWVHNETEKFKTDAKSESKAPTPPAPPRR